jgi:hypothetical protein
MESDTVKLLPRNVAALRQGQDPQAPPRVIAGNPMSTRLESGIGNCFPGLECDLRNLERRFFPCLEVDIQDNLISVVSVDLEALGAAVRAKQLIKSAADRLRRIAAGLNSGETFTVRKVRGTFGNYGFLTLTIAHLREPTSGRSVKPPDAWTAIRMLPEDSTVTVHIRAGARGSAEMTITGRRARYLDHHGALAAAFQPGELTQSLCSPWTHDFRDCNCFYWASNHPDIAKPPIEKNAAESPDWNRPVPWERADRTPGQVPPPATELDDVEELDYYEINHRWQELNFVLALRETILPYVPDTLIAPPLKDLDTLKKALRYAAGVELAVVHEYLAAAFSFKSPDTLQGELRHSVIAAKAEIMRIAVGEMHHLRVVNDVLKLFPNPRGFEPALRVAKVLPASGIRKQRPVTIRAADPDTIDRFIDVERPSTSVDGLYSSILITLETLGTAPQRQAIRAVMSEGEDHFETFRFIKEWLRPHDPAEYLRALNMQPATSAINSHVKLQEKYLELLNQLFRGYSQGFPDGGEAIKQARATMVSRAGIDDLADAISEEKKLVWFEPIDDPRFGSVDPP